MGGYVRVCVCGCGWVWLEMFWTCPVFVVAVLGCMVCGLGVGVGVCRVRAVVSVVFSAGVFSRGVQCGGGEPPVGPPLENLWL